jgi:hypothetical protein
MNDQDERAVPPARGQMKTLRLSEVQARMRSRDGAGAVCRRCGCRHIVADENGARVCRNCGAKAPGVTAAYSTLMRCAKCGAMGHVSSSRKADGYRWWKCEACGNTWKEVGREV